MNYEAIFDQHLAALVDLELVLAELLVLELELRAGATMLELDLGLELYVVTKLTLELDHEAGGVEDQAVICRRPALLRLIRTVVVIGEQELAVAGQLLGGGQARCCRERRHAPAQDRYEVGLALAIENHFRFQ